MGASRIFRDVLTTSLVVPANAGTHNHQLQLFYTLVVIFRFQQHVPRRMGPGVRRDDSNQIPKYLCCKSGSAISCSDVPLHTVLPRSMM
jgi:hypothetical protein